MIHALVLAAQIFVNGQVLNATAIETNGTIYVPVDAIARALGVEVTIKQDAVQITSPAPPPAIAPAPPPSPPPPPTAAVAPKVWTQPAPPSNLTAIHGRLTWTESFITTRPADYGAQVWLVPEADVAALAKAAGGRGDEPIRTEATGWPAKLDTEYKFLKSVADGEGRFGFDNVSPGTYLLIMVSRGANGLAARDRHGKMRFKKIVVRAGEIVDASFNFGVTAYKD
jgi:hypothetical protein